MFRSATRVCFVLLGAASVLVLVLAVARKLDPLAGGLTATYFSNIGWSSAPARDTLDSSPSTDSIVAAWGGSPPSSFSTTWIGSFIILSDGTYTFATTSDDGSWIYVDGRLVVDNGDHHLTRRAVGTVRLARGVHAIFVKYFQDGGGFAFGLSWARDGAPLEPLPAWMLFPRQAEFSRLLMSAAVKRAFPAAVLLWLGALLLAAGAALVRPLRRALRVLSEDPARLVLAALVAGSLVLNVAGIWWGLPSAWAGDEITPKDVFIALSRHFSGGWFNRYPPLQFYVLSATFSPASLATSLGWLRLSDRTHDEMMFLIGRLVSVAAGAGTLMAMYACGARAFGKRAGLFAAAMMAVVTPFIYYAKTANPEVPYLFWFALSLVFYLRLLSALALTDFVLFAAAATAAICTKDQAYALYLSAPFVIVFRLWRSNRDRRVSHPLARALLDVRLWLAGAAAAVLFAACYDLPFNWSGLVQHVRDITGSGSQSYRMVAPTFAGRVALLRLTAALDQRSWGWPLWLVSLCGMFVALKETRARGLAIGLMLIIAWYYLGFIDVILYDYDRYLLPICAVQALFGGLALDRFLRPRRQPGQAVRRMLVGAVFAYTLLYGATVDALMLHDSRYTVESWLRDHVGPDQLIGRVFPLVVLPRLDDVDSEDIGTIDDLRRIAPQYFLLNADYAQAIDAGTPIGQLVAGLQHQTLGYHKVFGYRAPTPWPWLPGANPDLAGPRLEMPPVSFLRDVNPHIEIYRREAAR